MAKRHLPTPRDLEIVQQHIADLKSKLGQSASTPEIAFEVGRLLAGFPVIPTDAPAQLRIQGFLDALDGLPIWAINRAREKVLKGETNLDGRFAPTPPQFAMLAKNMMAPAERDLADLESIARRADPVEPSCDEQRRVATGFARLKMELKGVG